MNPFTVTAQGVERSIGADGSGSTAADFEKDFVEEALAIEKKLDADVVADY